MKENKGKGLADEETMQKTHSQSRPDVGDKRKTLSKTIDLRNLPSLESSSLVLSSLLLLNNHLYKYSTWTRPSLLELLCPSLL